MAVIIPNVTNWSVTPQNGQEDYFTKMNIWLSESTSVIASLSTAITKINESNAESNDNLEEVLTARDEAVEARNEAVTAVATLTDGAIDDITIAPNKAFSNQFITNNYYDKDTIDSKVNINGFTNKSTPIDTDNIAIQETGGVFKKLSWANLKATLLTYFDTFYSRTTSIFGIGQTWHDVSPSRAIGGTYTNSDTKLRKVRLITSQTATEPSCSIVVGGKQIYSGHFYGSSNTRTIFEFEVPVGETYIITLTNASKFAWWEFY